MSISIKHLILAFVVILTFMPYYLFADAMGLSVAILSSWVVVVLQLCSLLIVALCAYKTESRSLKLFWQYLSFAAVFALLGNFIPLGDGDVTSLLLNDYLALFVFFFMLMAIETNPHLSELPIKKYISGSVPAIFFTVILFCYFVLLPAEFAEPVYLQGKPSLLFAALTGAVILVRLLICLFNYQQHYWRYVFGLLALGCGLMLSNFIVTFLDIDSGVQSQPGYLSTLLVFLPYCMLVGAASAGLSQPEETKPIERTGNSEPYILILMLLMVGIHLYGLQGQLFYITESQLQSAIVGLWLLLGAGILWRITVNNNSLSHNLRKQVDDAGFTQQELTRQNTKLTNALLNSEEKAIVRASNNAILTTTVEGEILSANPAAVQMFQSLEQELKGTKVNELFSKNDEMHVFFDFQSNVYSLQRRELGISVECVSLRSDGTEFPAQAELQWAETEDQPLIVITFINLTARKLAEKQTLELKDKFIANISHEFRTPLTIINGIIDRYSNKATTTAQSEDLNTAKRNGLRLVRMVEQLLELSRLSDNPTLSMSNYRLSTLMAMPVDSFSRLAEQQDLTFSSNIPDNMWLECDAQAFEKIIFNLLANAVKYTPGGGDIKVNAYCEQDTIILDVIDSGIGISKASKDKIFERFQRSDDPMNKTTFGVGIGLSLVNELVNAHGWRISLVSEQGQGSKFSLSIPMIPAQETEAHLPAGLSANEVSSILVEQRTVSSNQVSHSQQVVLVIEDNADMQSHIKQVVEQHHHVILAGNGELGAQLAEEYLPDLIVCDLMLPGIDGFEVLTRVKQAEVTAHIPVILLTARSDMESRLQGLNLQADEYLCKPFNQNELLTRIQNLIDNRKHLQSTYLNKFTEDQKAQRLQHSQENVEKLTSSEEKPVENVNLDEKFLTKLESLVAKHYADPDLGIDKLAAGMAMSDRQLQRKLKVLLGTNPNNFIREFRLKKAKELLKEGKQIGIVAFDVGFSSQTYFGRCFKEAFDCTPKQYQAKVANGEA